MNSNIVISQNIEELSEKFARIINDSISGKKDSINIALSGGSTPESVFDYLSSNFKTNIDWNKINFFWGDERCVPSDHPESNYLMTYEHLFSKIPVSEKNIFKISGGSKPELEAQRYSELILSKVPSEDLIPSFDIVMLGLGEDGHTASIFRDSIDLISDNRICAVSQHPVSNQKRITLTGTVINNAKEIVFIVSGKNKSKVVDTIINKIEGFEKLPASFIKPVNGKLTWLLNEDVIYQSSNNPALP